jgi:hypothetical protein
METEIAKKEVEDFNRQNIYGSKKQVCPEFAFV